MSNTPKELRYTASHSWIKQEQDGTLTIGITDFAQNSLGDIVFVQLPADGMHYEQDQQIAMVESVKTGSDIYAPVRGKVTAVNEALQDNPELINEDPYQAWIYKLIPASLVEVEQLLSAADYQASIE